MARRDHTALCPHVLAAFLAVLAAIPASATEEAEPAGFGQPNAAITQALDARPAPFVEASPDGEQVALLFRRAMPSLAELVRPVIGLAGRLVDPANNGPARGIRFDRISLLTPDGTETVVALPPDARLSTVRWSPDSRRLAFLNHAPDSIELWTIEAESGRLGLIASGLNAAFAEPFAWLPDGSGFLVRLVPSGRGDLPQRSSVPSGPEIRESDGRPAPVQTLSNLLEDTHDDALFQHYFTAQLAFARLDASAPRMLGEPAIVPRMSIAPSGEQMLVERLREPFSRAFTASDFPREIVVLDVTSGEQRTVVSLPGADRAVRLRGDVDRGPRAMAWRPDHSATLVWAEAAEDGTARDRLHSWQASSRGDRETIATVEGRIVRVQWATPRLALIEARPPGGGRARRIAIDPSQSDQFVAADDFPPIDHDRRLLTAGDAADPTRLALSNAGRPLVLDDADGSGTDRILELDPRDATQKIVHEFPSASMIQRIVAVLDPGAGMALAWRESAERPPNLYLLRAGGDVMRLTDFGDPAPGYAGMQMIPLDYRRADNVPLAAKLYLPAAVQNSAPDPLPTVLWAYPVGRTSSPAAQRLRGSVSPFTRPNGVDPLLLTAIGYSVLIADMPIVAAEEGAVEDFVDQLVANSAAAIDAGVASGWVDRDRVAVAGHSFGAGMVANLLANSDLFAAGIALSGAYNRTLTPFGFQTDRRSLWKAPDAYRQASPFLRADSIEAPLLLIHGMQDTNSGTLPMQSERLFAALRGLGKPARLVLLPGEGHTYTARESVLHTMYEIEDWLARHLSPPTP